MQSLKIKSFLRESGDILHGQQRNSLDYLLFSVFVTFDMLSNNTMFSTFINVVKMVKSVETV